MQLLTFSVLKNCKYKLLSYRLARSLNFSTDSVQPKEDPDLATGSPLVQPSPGWPAAAAAERAAALRDMRVLPDFISAAEEAALMAELEPYLNKMRYEFDHWDNAIQGYRETERSQWSPGNAAVLARVSARAFTPGAGEPLPHQHVLDLAPGGHIKPHVDAVRFCGPVIAGLCLLAPAVMRLQHERRPALLLDALLPPRCLYIMRDSARYLYSHAVLESGAEWRGRPVLRPRRVAVITRSTPPPAL